jgi:hypothetical protein
VCHGNLSCVTNGDCVKLYSFTQCMFVTLLPYFQHAVFCCVQKFIYFLISRFSILVKYNLFKFLIRVKNNKMQGTYFQVVRFLILLHSVFVYVIPCTTQELQENIWQVIANVFQQMFGRVFLNVLTRFEDHM